MTLYWTGRYMFGFCLALSWVMSSWHVLAPEEMPYSYGLAAKRARFDPKAIAIVLVGTLLYMPLVLAFTLRWSDLPAAIGIIAVLGVLRQVERATWESDVVVELGKYVPSIASLSGYVFVYLVASTDDPWALERYAWEGGCGVMAAAMCVAGIEKWLLGSTRWFTNNGLPLMLAERAHLGPPFLRWVRAQLLRVPRISAILGGLTNIAEVGAILFAFPMLRWPMFLYCEIMLGGIAFILGYFELEWLFVFAALTFLTMGIPL
jgi:hypothetical protein